MNDEGFTKIGIMKEGVGRLVIEILQPDPTAASLGILRRTENSTLDELLETLGIVYAVISICPKGILQETIKVGSFLADENGVTYPKTDYDDVKRLLDLLDGKNANDFYSADMTEREKKLIYIIAMRAHITEILRKKDIINSTPSAITENTEVA